jgi:hypothetical protein
MLNKKNSKHQGETKMKTFKVYQYKHEVPNKDGKYESTLHEGHKGSYPFSTNPSQGTKWWIEHSGHGRNFLSIVEPQLEHTMTVKGYDLEDVFFVGNHLDCDVDEGLTWNQGKPSDISGYRFLNSYSVSVGDIAEDEKGNKFVVDNFGFTEIDADGNIVLNKKNTIK